MPKNEPVRASEQRNNYPLLSISCCAVIGGTICLLTASPIQYLLHYVITLDSKGKKALLDPTTDFDSYGDEALRERDHMATTPGM